MASAHEKETAVDHRDELHDADTAVQLSHDVDETTYSAWSPKMYKLYVVLVIAYLAGALNGYDGSLMGGLNGMTSYQHYFNM